MAAGLALFAWFSGLALLTLIIEPTAAVIVLGPGKRAVEAASIADMQLLDAHRAFIHARSDQPGFVRKLYRAGAWLVWPAPDRSGCFL